MKRLVIRFNSPVILCFAALALAATILGYITNNASTAALFSVYRAPLNDPLTYARFFTHVLGHSDYSHYMGNMLLLLLIGPLVEERYGSKATLLCILATALTTGLVQFLFFPRTALLGASGIVFMMIVLSAFTGTKKEGVPITLLLVVVLYLGGEIIDGLFTDDNVSQITHIVGGICGLILGFSLRGQTRRR